MKYYISFTVSTLLLCSSVLNAQTDVKINKRDFESDKIGFETAWKHVTDGDSFFRLKGTGYGSAFNEYVQASIYNSGNPALNYKTGVAALLSDNKEKAEEFLVKAYTMANDLTDDILLYLGRALQYSGKYEQAIDKLNSYLLVADKKEKENIILANKYIAECSAALIISQNILRTEIKNIGSNINSVADDYAPVLSSDGNTVFFASRRERSKSSKSYKDTKFDENIFFSILINDTWEMANSSGRKLTTTYCEAPLYLDQAGDVLYLYAGYENGGDIMVSHRKKGSWKKPERIPFNINSAGNETSFTFSPSGDEVWFVTDKGKEIIGGKDIYFIQKESEKKWSKPVNAGPEINSEYDEESVRFSVAGDTLFFCSKGHNTIGGFDIFYSVRDSSGVWGAARNLGSPVNTPWDELFFTPANSAYGNFYFASNRSGSLGGLDIFQGMFLPPEREIPVVIPEPAVPVKPDTIIVRDTVVIIKEVVQTPPEPVAEPVVVPEQPKETFLYLTGKVLDSETGDPIMAKIDVIDLTTDLVVSTTASSDVDGSYRIRLPEKKSYMVDIRGNGFLSDMKRINIPANYIEEVYKLDIPLIKVKVGKKVVLNNILFETGKSVLTPGSSAELDRLVGIMEDNAQMRIEISGHTDNTGSEPLNNRLSESRAKAVVDYLVQKGVDQNRLEFRGYGPSQPIADNSTAAGRKQNRRVEFKILGF